MVDILVNLCYVSIILGNENSKFKKYHIIKDDLHSALDSAIKYIKIKNVK